MAEAETLEVGVDPEGLKEFLHVAAHKATPVEREYLELPGRGQNRA